MVEIRRRFHAMETDHDSKPLLTWQVARAGIDPRILLTNQIIIPAVIDLPVPLRPTRCKEKKTWAWRLIR
jgi:hypothetical protein